MRQTYVEGYEYIIAIAAIGFIFLISWLITSRAGRRKCPNCFYYGIHKGKYCPLCDSEMDDKRRIFKEGGGGFS